MTLAAALSCASSAGVWRQQNKPSGSTGLAHYRPHLPAVEACSDMRVMDPIPAVLLCLGRRGICTALRLCISVCD